MGCSPFHVCLLICKASFFIATDMHIDTRSKKNMYDVVCCMLYVDVLSSVDMLVYATHAQRTPIGNEPPRNGVTQ